MEQSYPGRMLGRVERSETRRSLSPSRAPAGCARLSPAFTRPTAVSAKFTVGVTLKPLRQQCFFASGMVGNSGITARKQQISSDKVDLSGRPLGVSGCAHQSRLLDGAPSYHIESGLSSGKCGYS
jgi:hypothetical protein